MGKILADLAGSVENMSLSYLGMVLMDRAGFVTTEEHLLSEDVVNLLNAESVAHLRSVEDVVHLRSVEDVVHLRNVEGVAHLQNVHERRYVSVDVCISVTDDSIISWNRNLFMELIATSCAN